MCHGNALVDIDFVNGVDLDYYSNQPEPAQCHAPKQPADIDPRLQVRLSLRGVTLTLLRALTSVNCSDQDFAKCPAAEQSADIDLRLQV